MSAIDMVYGVFLFSVILTGLGMFAVSTLTEYGITTDASDYTSITAVTEGAVSTIDSASEKLQEGELENTGFLGIAMSLGSLAWSTLKILLGTFDIIIQLPTVILPMIGLTGASWLLPYFAGAVGLTFLVLLLKASTGANL